MTILQGKKPNQKKHTKKNLQQKNNTEKRFKKLWCELLERGTQPPLSFNSYVTVHRFTSLLYFVKKLRFTHSSSPESTTGLTFIHSSADSTQFFFKASTSAILDLEFLARPTNLVEFSISYQQFCEEGNICSFRSTCQHHSC